jgi:hypothetical protein
MIEAENRRREILEEGSWRRVATLNAWHDKESLEERNESAGNLIKDLGCELVFLQEIPREDPNKALDTIETTSGLRTVAFEEGDITCTAILAKEGRAHEGIEVRHIDTSVRYAVAESRLGDYKVIVCSAHQPWGGWAENLRVRGAIKTNQELSKKEGFDGILLGGDFNALENSLSIQYLKGLIPVEGECAQWTDCFEISGVGDGYTSSPENHWARMVGESRGLEESWFLPQRRIDYIFIKGYARGGVFTPLRTFVQKTTLNGGIYPSDHWMVVADLYVP